MVRRCGVFNSVRCAASMKRILRVRRKWSTIRIALLFRFLSVRATVKQFCKTVSQRTYRRYPFSYGRRFLNPWGFLHSLLLQKYNKQGECSILCRFSLVVRWILCVTSGRLPVRAELDEWSVPTLTSAQRGIGSFCLPSLHCRESREGWQLLL